MINESIRRDMKTVEISLSSEVILCRLLGRPMLYIHGKQGQKTWRKVMKRVVNALRNIIEENLNSDGFHKWRMNVYLEGLADACKSKNNSDPEIIITLASMIYELVGGAPNHSGKRSLTKKDFVLNTFRTLHYVQTPYQKVCTILEASHYKPYCDHHEYRELFEEYVHNFNGDPKGFLTWYKQKYSEVYMDIF